MSTLTIAPGTTALWKGNPVVVLRMVTADSVRIRGIRAREERDVAISELQPQAPSRQPVQVIADISLIDDEDWEIAIEHYKAIEPLLANGARTGADVGAVAEAAQVTPSTIYRWLARFEESGGLVSSLIRKKRHDAGKPRISPEAQDLIEQVVNKELLTKRQKSPVKARRKLDKLCRKAQVKTPHLSTLRRHFHAVAPELRETKRRGPEAARKYKPNRGTVPNADYPYAVIQIDHTPCDVQLVDTVHRLAVGRPWITLACDVYSRMVVGYYISFDPPGMLGTGLCIANTILGKDAFLARLGLNYEWPCQGLPTVIQLDNAREFRGNALGRACEEYGIELNFRKVGKPQYGGHIERLLGTLLREMHEVPGTTFSNPREKGDFDSEADAAMTLDEFEVWLANLIVGSYNNRVHSSIKVPPLTKYKQGILGTDDSPGPGLIQVATDPDRLRISFLPMDERAVHPDGIVIDNIWYYGDVLRRWVNALKPGSLNAKRKFIIRRDPRDISFIYFYDPDLEQYFRIPYKNTVHPAISLWELRAVNRFLIDQGKKAEDENTVFSAHSEMVRIEEEAVRKTRKVRMKQERRRRHKALPRAIDPADQSEAEHADDESDDGPILPFDEIESM